jgi:hypothetical protein
MFILEQEEPELYDRVQEQNLNRRYELLTNCIEIGLKKGPVAFDKYMLWALNHVAVANISQFGGRFREEPIYVGDHKPPHFREVPDWMDRFISTVQENWYIWSPTELASKLDSPVYRREWADCESSLLLLAMRSFWIFATWKKDCSRAHSRG